MTDAQLGGVRQQPRSSGPRPTISSRGVAVPVVPTTPFSISASARMTS